MLLTVSSAEQVARRYSSKGEKSISVTKSDGEKRKLYKSVWVTAVRLNFTRQETSAVLFHYLL